MDQGCNLGKNRERACVLNLRGRILPKGQENHERELTRRNLREVGHAVNRQFSRNSGGRLFGGDGGKNDAVGAGAKPDQDGSKPDRDGAKVDSDGGAASPEAGA